MSLPDPRGTSTARGYGVAHQTIRARYAEILRRRTVPCPRCGGPIKPGDPWDLDHSDDRGGYLGPSHRRCNRGWRRRLFRRNSREW